MVDFIVQMHSQVHESIKLADQKGPSIIAFSTAFIFILIELLKRTERRFKLLNVAIVANVLMFLLSGGLALWAIYPPIGIADRDVHGGDLTRPDQIISFGQEEFRKKMLASTVEERAENACALLYARSEIRAWKLARFKWSVCAAGVAAILFSVNTIMFTTNKYKADQKLHRPRRRAKASRANPVTEVPKREDEFVSSRSDHGQCHLSPDQFETS